MILQPSYTYEELLEFTKAELFALGETQLPAPNMLMFDRITHISDQGGEFGKGEVIAELDVHPDLWFFGCHFLGDPVMPGSLGIEALWQMLGFFLAWPGRKGRGRAFGVEEVKFREEIRPSVKVIRYHVHVRHVREGALTLARGNGIVYADDRVAYRAKGLRSGLFTS